MGASPTSPTLIDWLDLPIHGFQASNSVVHTRQSLVGPDGLISIHDRIQSARHGCRPRSPPPGEPIIPYGDGGMLFHLVPDHDGLQPPACVDADNRHRPATRRPSVSRSEAEGHGQTAPKVGVVAPCRRIKGIPC